MLQMLRKPTLRDELEMLISLYGFEKVRLQLHRIALDRVQGRIVLGDQPGTETWLQLASKVEAIPEKL